MSESLYDSLDPYSKRAYDYAVGVIDGSIPSCNWTKLPCQRFIDDLNRDDVPWHYDPNYAFEVCDFIEKNASR